MLKVFGNNTILPTNGVWTVIVVGYLAVHTVLFTHVNERLNKTLRRMDKLELLLTNTIASKDLRVKEIRMSWSRNLENVLDANRDQTEGKEFLRIRREAKRSYRVARLLREIKRLEQR